VADPNQLNSRTRPAPKNEGRIAIVTNVGCGMRWTRAVHETKSLSADGEVEEVWMPRFNSLALFRVPTPHIVSYVAPFATQPRYAITGWLCDA